MANYPSCGVVALLVSVMALAMLASVEADIQLKPVANCWRNKTLADGYATVFYFGYDNQELFTTTVNVSMSNYLTSTVELGIDPMTTFYPRYHGLSLSVTVPPFPGINTPIAVQWYLNGYVATVDSASTLQQCPQTQTITYTIDAPSTTNVNQAMLIDAFVQRTGASASNFTVTGISSPVLVSQVNDGPVSVYASGYVLYNAYVDPNDDSFRAALIQALGAESIVNFYGAITSVDVPGVLQPSAPLAIVPEEPVKPQVVPLAHCWEPSNNGFSYFYFGYESTFANTHFIEPNTPQNQFLGAPANFEPFPVFYPSLNGYVTRVHAPDGSLIQWNLNGSGALLDGANVDFACDASANDAGLTTVAVWSSGTYTANEADAAVVAMASVTHLPVEKVSATWTSVNGGFRAEFTLKANGSVTAYAAVYRSVNNFHEANGTLNYRWKQIFGQGAARYASAGHPNIIGQPLPQSDSFHVPIAHCWVHGQTQGSKIAYFGYLSNYQHTLSYLPGPSNWVANSGGFDVPTILYPGYNGFSVAIAASGESAQQSAVAWNLAGNTVSLNFNNDSLQCHPNRPVSFTISYTGVLLSNIDQYQAAEDLTAFVKQSTGSMNVQASFEPTVGGFYANVQMKFATVNTQYAALDGFLSSCNRLGSYTTKSRLSSMAGNATVLYCQSTGTGMDVIGQTGTTAEVTMYGTDHITLTAYCWKPNGPGLTAYFGYTSNSALSYYATSTIQPQPQDAYVPVVFSFSEPYAAHISTTSSSISWTVGSNSIQMDITQTDKQCGDNVNTTATLGFERLLTAPPDVVPVIEWISKITGFPADNILATWTFDSTSDFVLAVQFYSHNPLGRRATTTNQDPILAASFLVQQLTSNATAEASISNVVGAHLYYATGSTPRPVTPTPQLPPTSTPAAPAKPDHKHLSGALVFGIIVVVLLGVGIIGGILFYFLKYHKGMCRDDVETRPLLAE